MAENTVGKGEIAHYEPFFLFPQCFQKACFPGVSKGVIVREWVNLLFANEISPDKLTNVVWYRLNHSQIHLFETVPSSEKLPTTQMWLI